MCFLSADVLPLPPPPHPSVGARALLSMAAAWQQLISTSCPDPGAEEGPEEGASEAQETPAHGKDPALTVYLMHFYLSWVLRVFWWVLGFGVFFFLVGKSLF